MVACIERVVNRLYILISWQTGEHLMEQAHRRHDISDTVWQTLEPHLLGRKGTWGGNARDNRRFINAADSKHRRVVAGFAAGLR